MKQQSKKKKQLLAVGAGLAVVAAVSGTFAWTTANDQRINRVAAAAITDGTVTVEEVWSEKPIVANTQAEKKVKIKNSGSAPVYVRVSYEEVLKSLVSQGIETKKDAPYTIPVTPTLTDDIPVNFSGAKYKDAATSGYTDVTSKVKLADGKALPTSVKVYASGSVTKDPSTGTNKTTLEAVFFNEYIDGSFQAMEGGVKIDGDPTVGSSVSDWDFTLTDPSYKVYAGGYQYKAVNWAKATVAGAEGAKDGAALLGSKGIKYGVEYDYTAETIGNIPDATPAVLESEIPTANGAVKDTQAGRAALQNQGIKISYDNAISTPAVMAPSTWVYNKEDGYFYYSSVLEATQETPLLMNAIIFDETVGKDYTNAIYDLIVKTEAIQANKAALTDKAGWSMGTTGDSKIIYDKLAEQEVK